MKKDTLKALIEQAAGRKNADLVIRNVQIVDVYNAEIIQSDLAIGNGKILGWGHAYQGNAEIDGKNQYVVPGLIDPHIHIESASVSPAAFGKLATPHGTTTILADPHEIVNVAGMHGLSYMVASAQQTALRIKYMMPSCVPAASPQFETSGAIIKAPEIKQAFAQKQAYGLAEFMNYVGVVNAEDDVLDELLVAQNEDRLIDGHSPSLAGQALNAYRVAGIHDDHECTTTQEMKDRLQRGMYVYLRYGTVSKNLPTLLKALTPQNSRFCALCGDDIQAVTLRDRGHLDESIRVCVQNGVPPITAIQMATINTAQCCGLNDRGGIAPGLWADFLLVSDLTKFKVTQTYIGGKLVAENGMSLEPAEKPVEGYTDLLNSVHLNHFETEKLSLKLPTRRAHVIGLETTSRTKDLIKEVTTNDRDEFVWHPDQDIVKVAVVERHHQTGNVGVGLISGFKLQYGAIASTIGHDSHNIVVLGVNDEEMAAAVNALVQQQGGGIAVRDGKVIAALPLKIGGLMSDEAVETLIQKQNMFNQLVHEDLQLNSEFNPLMKLGAIPLDVIPNLRLTDKGLMDVTQTRLIPVGVK
ncbi:adenine deaminase [Pediococcus siamensis]|uniref:adenine deaminase n=1 Tax=Pediococcus siamensis TaxID=381829 RepID=UPI0039A1A0DD